MRVSGVPLAAVQSTRQAHPDPANFRPVSRVVSLNNQQTVSLGPNNMEDK